MLKGNESRVNIYPNVGALEIEMEMEWARKEYGVI